MKYHIGMMQGRLTRPNGRGIQFFPFDNWENEFLVAAQIGLHEIEFIFDYENYQKNPLWFDGGRQLIKVVKESGVKVNAVCFDYFMRRAFFKESGKRREELLVENKFVLKNILQNMKDVGIHLIEIPLVDASSLKNDCEKQEFFFFLEEIVSEGPLNMKYGLETDLPPEEFRNYLELFESECIGANYDSGNSSGIGYDSYKEITTLGNYIFNIHIKDRIYQGKTVKLGTGSADFEKMFSALSQINYRGDFILQAARGMDGQETENIMEQKKFLENYIHNFLS